MPGKRLWTMVAITAIALSAGCTGGDESSDDSAPSGSGSHHVVIGVAEPKHLLPTNVSEVSGSQILASLFYPLVTFDTKSAPVTAAAASIKPDRANRVWTIKLKPGFTFGNGEPVTADNYLDAWNYGAYGPNGQFALYYFSRIDGFADLQPVDPDGSGPQKATPPKRNRLKGLKKVNDLTFTVTLSEGFAGWESILGYDAFYPLPKAAFDSPGVLAKGFEDAIIGNGPFKMTGSWEHDSQIQVERASGFQGPAPKVDGITWKIYPDSRAEYAELMAGNVDVQTDIPLENLPSAPSDLGSRFQTSPNSSFQFVGFPTFQKEFAKPEVRRALSMAIDRKAMTDQIFLGSEVPATSFVAPVVAGYRPDTCGENCKYNPTRAKQLYTAAGGPASITIAYNGDGGHRAWVDAMCNQIANSLGVTCTGVAEPSFADLLTKVEGRQRVGLIRQGWVMDYPLMEDFLGPLYSTGGSQNYYGYSNPAVDSLIKEGSAARTPKNAIRKWQQAEDILAQDMPIIPLRFGQNVYGSSERVRNVSVDLFQKVDVYRIELVG